MQTHLFAKNLGNWKKPGKYLLANHWKRQCCSKSLCDKTLNNKQVYLFGSSSLTSLMGRKACLYQTTFIDLLKRYEKWPSSNFWTTPCAALLKQNFPQISHWKTDFESTTKAYKSDQNSSFQEVLIGQKGYYIWKYWNMPRLWDYL